MPVLGGIRRQRLQRQSSDAVRRRRARGLDAGALVPGLCQARTGDHPEALPLDWACLFPSSNGRRDFAAKKGYPKAYLHGQQRLWEIFERQGFHKVNEAPFHFSDHEYGAFAADLDVPQDAPSVFTDPMVLNRPEDQLNRAGILEKSMDRGASNPHAEWAERRHH